MSTSGQMKILFIVPYVPNKIRVRPYELIRTLSNRGHQVVLATLWSDVQEQQDLQTLADSGIEIWSQRLTKIRSISNCIVALPGRVPLQSVFCWQPAFARMLARNIERTRFDVIHVEHLRGARYGLTVKKAAASHNPPTPIVWDSVDCISHLFEQAAQNSRSVSGRLMTLLDLKRTRQYEGWLVHQFDRVLTTSQADRDALSSLAAKLPTHFFSHSILSKHQDTGVQKSTMQSAESGCADGVFADNIIVLPNGVDIQYFSPNGVTRKPATLAFTGKMSYHANVTAALHLINDIMPHVWARRADVEVQIVGKDPPAKISTLDSTSNSRKQAENGRGTITVTGFVPEMRSYLREATVAVAPVPYGAGIQNKVLEAMACGAPVIASPQAASGLLASTEQSLMVAADPQAFARSIIDLLSDAKQRQELGKAGRIYTEEYHSWDAIVERLENIYFSATQYS